MLDSVIRLSTPPCQGYGTSRGADWAGSGGGKETGVVACSKTAPSAKESPVFAGCLASFPQDEEKDSQVEPDVRNAAWVCRSCNASKGARRLHEFYTTSKGGLQAANYDVPRLAEGKYLKLLYGLFEDAGVLGVTEDGLHARFCPDCDLDSPCTREHSVGKMSPRILDGVGTAALLGQD